MKRITKDSNIALVELPPTETGGLSLNGRQDHKISHNVYSGFRLPARGLHLLHAILDREGYKNIKLVIPHLYGKGSPNERDVAILRESDIVMASSITATSPQTRQLVHLLYEDDPEKLFLFGGFDPTFRPDFYLNGRHNGLIVRGEGEKTLVETLGRFCNGAQEVGDIPGLMFRDGDEIVTTDARKYLTADELNDLPYPIYPEEIARMIRIGAIETSRGCPNSCEFCGIMQFYGERKYRAKSVEHIMGELESMKDIGKATFYSADNLLAMPKQVEILRRIAESGLQKPGIAQLTAVSSKTPGIIQALRDANIEVLCMGVESFNNESLAFLGKPYSAEQNKEGLGAYMKGGLNNHLMMMPGEDGDTPDSLRYEVEQAKKYGTTAQFFPPGPLPGTPLRERIESSGRLLRPTENERWELYNGHFVLSRPKNFSPLGLQEAINQMHMDFYHEGKDLSGMSKSQQLIYRNVKKGVLKVLESNQMKNHLEFLKSVS